MKKLLVILLSVMLVASIFVGCDKPAEEVVDEPGTDDVQQPEEPDTEEPDPEQQPDDEPLAESIKITSGLWSNPSEQQYIREEVLPLFEEETGIKVELEILPGDDIDKLMQAQKGSGTWTSDVVLTHSGDMPEYIELGYVAPLNDIIAGLDITILEAFNGSTSIGSNTFYIPVSADVYLTICNNKALPYLPAGADLESLTWEQYKDWAIAIAKGEGSAKVSMPAQPVKAMVYEVGGIGLSYGAGFPEINSEGVKSAWALIGEMIAEGAIVETSFNYGDPKEQMKTEEAWLSFYHMVPVGEIYSSAPAQFTVAPAPAGPEGNGTIAGAWGVGITSGTPRMREAEMFVKFLTREDILYKISTGTGGFIPPVEEVIDVLGDEPTDEVIKKGLGTLNAGIPHGVPGSDYVDWGAVKTVYDEVFQKLWDDGGVVDEAFLDAQQTKLEDLKK